MAMVEAFICSNFRPVWWKCACLLVNSGVIGEVEKGTNYGQISSAICSMIEDVNPPSINKSQFSFEVDVKTNRIYYGLKPIVGLGKDVANTIVEDRKENGEYTSFQNFLDRLPNLTFKKVLTLIKAGCFDEFEKDRMKLAIGYVTIIEPVKKATMVQLPTILSETKIDGFEKELKLYKLRQVAMGKIKITPEENTELQKWFISNYPSIPYEVSEFGLIAINKKEFDKIYNKEMVPLKNEISKPNYGELIARTKRRKIWVEECLGTISRWEMLTLNNYFSGHEIDSMPIKEYFTYSIYNSLPEEPEVTPRKLRSGTIIQDPVLTSVAGTVIDKNKAKSIISLLTEDGVITVRIPKGKFKYYDEKLTVNGVTEKSWFDRGSVLVIKGFRRNSEFVNRKKFNDKTSIYKITSYTKTNLQIRDSRINE